MNTVSMNAVLLDGGTIIKTGDGGGGGATINNQNKTVEIVENGSLSVVADSGYTGLGEVAISVNVPTSGGGGGTAPKSDVNFYDYDGTRLYSYTWAEAQAMTELPALPEREGLICQEWNYSLEDIKAQNGKCDVGATYITDDGKTRIYLHIADDARMTFPLGFSQSVANGVVIDWGDGSATEVVEGTGNVNPSHTYASIGDYVITLAPNDGCTLNFDTYICGGLPSPSSGLLAYHSMIQKIEMGTNVTTIGDYVIINCPSISSVVIPNSVTSIGDYAFMACLSISSVVIPNSVTSIGDYAFNGSFSSGVIPNSVTSIGDSVFRESYFLSSVVIPNSVTSIGDSVFMACNALSSIVISNNVTSIGSKAFCQCPSLISITIPNSVTSIGDEAFSTCFALAICDFSTHTAVPSLGSRVFSNTPSDLKIIVPDALYDEWIAATNWSSYASKIVKASEV